VIRRRSFLSRSATPTRISLSCPPWLGQDHVPAPGHWLVPEARQPNRPNCSACCCSAAASRLVRVETAGKKASNCAAVGNSSRKRSATSRRRRRR